MFALQDAYSICLRFQKRENHPLWKNTDEVYIIERFWLWHKNCSKAWGMFMVRQPNTTKIVDVVGKNISYLQVCNQM